MLKIEIPGREAVEIQNLVLDYNGTIATDGKLNKNVREYISELIKSLNIYILTADTNNTVTEECSKLGVYVKRMPKCDVGVLKGEFIESLEGNSISIGNGFNDVDMLSFSEISIAVIGNEGVYSRLILNSDIVVNNIEDAFNLILKPWRMKATLRT